jgi:FAD/FMN-containing dehydrogenase
VETIRYCNTHGLGFLAQNGGNGWATTFDMDREDVIINLRGLKSITLNDDGDQVTMSGGVSNDELIQFAYDNSLEVCTCSYHALQINTNVF